MKNKLAHTSRAFHLFFAATILLFFCSCGGPSTQELLIGEWLIKDVDSVIVLNSNGTWKLKTDDTGQTHSENKEGKKEQSKENPEKAEANKEGKKDAENKAPEGKKTEEKETKEDKKPQEESLGIWDIKDKILMISAEKDIHELEWSKGDKFDFEIVELTTDILKLKDKDGHPSEWERVKEKKKEGEKTAEDKEDKPLVIEGEPMVINLLQKLQYGKERYLCIKIDYHFKKPPEDPKKEKKKDEKKEGPAESFKYQFIHPEIKDAIIMHLGELQYRDVRNYDKLKGLKSGIEKRVAPYFGGELLGVVISDAIITSSKDSIDQFLEQYAPEPAKSEGGKEEKGKKEGGSEEKKSAH